MLPKVAQEGRAWHRKVTLYRQCPVSEVNSDLIERLALQVDDQWRAFAAFASVGLTPSKIVLKNDATNYVEDYDTNIEDFEKRLPEYLKKSREQKFSLCVRWIGQFIQVDDCDWTMVQKLRPYSFAVIETSRQNFQVWLGIDGISTKEQLQAIRTRLLKSLEKTGANGGAYGSVRWPGSFNYKPERQTPTMLFPMIVIESITLARKVTVKELEMANLLVEEVQPSRSSVTPFGFNLGRDWWPDYSRCVAEKPTRSEADARFVAISYRAGREPGEIVDKLLEVSERCQQKGTKYAEKTVEKVTNWLEKQAA